jgi:hypothetical protein
VVEQARLFLRQDHDSPGSVGEALEHLDIRLSSTLDHCIGHAGFGPTRFVDDHTLPVPRAYPSADPGTT